MLYYNTINDELKNSLITLMTIPVFQNFRLVGGTALSLQIGHRESIDIDLFSDAAYGTINFEEIEALLRATFKYVDSSTVPPAIGKSYFIGENETNSIKLDIFYTDSFIQPYIEEDGIRMATIEEIIAMKVDVTTHFEKTMRTNLITAILILFVLQINAQSLDEKIENLLELDGTIRNIENLISQTIDYQKQDNFGLSDNYWEGLEKKVTEKSLSEFKTLVKPIYSKNYKESEIDNLITFYSSPTGKLVTEKQPIIIEELNLPLMQWSQNLGSFVIEEIENRGSNESTSEEKEKFKTEFKDKYGLQILNLTDLSIDKEHNIGDLLIDFGKTDGKKDVTKIIRVKNNSDKEIDFQEPKFLSNEVIKFDLGNEPLGVGKTRDLKITLIAELAENKSYSMSSINYNNGDRIQFGIKYDAPAKEISFEISDRKMKFEKLKQDFSKPYVFILKNTGKKDFYISDIELDKQIAYLNWNKETIKPNEETEIRVVFSKQLIAKQNNTNLKLKVDLTKGEKGGFSSFANETIELIIE